MIVVGKIVADHIIVDKKDYDKTVKFINDNPEIAQKLAEFVEIDN